MLILGPLLQTMIDAYGWRTTYRIMAGVVPVLCLFGFSYSPNVQREEVDHAVVEENNKRCHIDVSVWKEPKFVAVCISASIMMFGHYVPQIHLVNTMKGNGWSVPSKVHFWPARLLSTCVSVLLVLFVKE